MLKIVVSLTDDSRGIIFDQIIFKVKATEQTLAKMYHSACSGILRVLLMTIILLNIILLIILRVILRNVILLHVLAP
jgi:hypothetical protein